MSEFARGTLTNKGLALLAKIQAGEATARFTKVTAGDGVLTGDPQELTELIHELYVCETIKSVETSGDVDVIITADVSSKLVSEGFFLREVGVWANDPDEGEILYAYTNAGSYVSRIPATGDGQANIFELNIAIQVSNTEDVQINIGGEVSRWTLIECVFQHDLNEQPRIIVTEGTAEIDSLGVYIDDNALQVKIDRRVSGVPTITQLGRRNWQVDYSSGVSFDVFLAAAYLRREQNLQDVADADEARDALVAAHRDHLHDERYLRREQNLADVADKDAARDTLSAAHVDHTHPQYLLRQLLIGTIMPWGGDYDTIPEGALPCDGGTSSRTGQTAGLFAKIGTKWGKGNGITTFNRPDLRDWFVRGASETREVGTAQEDAMQPITGRLGWCEVNNVNAKFADGAFYIENSTGRGADGDRANEGIRFGFDSSLQVRTADETRPRNKAVNYIIWAY